MSDTEVIENSKNSVDAILLKAKNRGIETNQRYKSLKKDHVVENFIAPNAEKPMDDKGLTQTASPDIVIAEKAIAESTIPDSAIEKAEVPKSGIAKQATSLDIFKMFQLFCMKTKDSTVDEIKLMIFLIQETGYGKDQDVLIKRDDFISRGGVNFRKLSPSLESLVEKRFVSYVIKKDKNKKYKLFTINEKFIEVLM